MGSFIFSCHDNENVNGNVDANANANDSDNNDDDFACLRQHPNWSLTPRKAGGGGVKIQKRNQGQVSTSDMICFLS